MDARYILAMVAGAVALAGCAEAGPPPLQRGEIVTRPAELPAFSAIAAGGRERILVRHGDEQRVSLSGGTSLLDRLNVAVVDGVLRVERQREAVNDQENVLGGATVTITMPRLRALTLSGNSYASVDRVDDGNFALDLSGASEADFSYALFDRLTLSMSGTSTTAINGRASAADVDMSGSSRLRGVTFGTRDADISASGTAQAELRATGRVQISARGAAEVKVDGNSNCQVARSGAARVTCVPD